MRGLQIVVTVGLFLLIPIILSGNNNTAVQLAGIRIVGPGSGLNGNELQAFHQQSGTTLALVIHAPGNKKIVEVDDDKCSLKTFTDNQENDLLDGIDWSGFPKISEDGRSALIEVTSKNRPSMGAEKLHVRGSVYLRVAASEYTDRIENMTLKTGTKVMVGQEAIQVMKTEIDNENLTIVLQISQSLKNNMKDIRFYSLSGQELEIWGRGSFTFGSVSQMEYNLDTNTIPEFLNIEIDIWKELENSDLPFEIEAGIGF